MSKLKSFINKIFYRPKLSFKGKNNLIIADKSVYFRRVRINIWGDNNKVIIGKNAYLHNTKINIGFPESKVENCVIKIGDDSGMNEMYMQIGESNSSITIGNECMISYNVEINCTDHHAIFDLDTNKLLNIGKSVEIGNHVWLCKNVVIQKNSKIPDGCIVGQGTVVAKKFETPNCVIVGNPAKVVRENIRWEKTRPNSVN